MATAGATRECPLVVLRESKGQWQQPAKPRRRPSVRRFRLDWLNWVVSGSSAFEAADPNSGHGFIARALKTGPTFLERQPTRLSARTLPNETSTQTNKDAAPSQSSIICQDRRRTPFS